MPQQDTSASPPLISFSSAFAEPLRLRPLRRLALIGNALPRRCGIASFTTHVADALRARFPDLVVDHYAMDDGSGVAYPADIRLIRADDPAAYREAAGLIEASGAEAIWVQHEFGIFGGEAGDYLLGLLERTSLPVMATLHTVLEDPAPAERRVMEALLKRCATFEVMARRGRDMLRSTYGVPERRISVNPHGVPDRALVDPATVKPRFGLAGRRVVMTFGLLAPDKGIRHMIEAMPAIVERHPATTYVVLGATHPNLVRHEGEAHREQLMALAEQLGVADHVRFVDAFLDDDDLLDWLQAVDVYVTPYLNLKQITSGTLSYAVAAGKPVVATPYVHATEILADGHGLIVPPRDSAALAEAVGGLLADDRRRQEIAGKAYARGREMLWPRSVERSMARLQAILRNSASPRSADGFRASERLSLDALSRMSDSTGLLQHAKFSIPDRDHGYCIDDNARALILTCRLSDPANAARLEQLATVYAAFVNQAWNPAVGRFRNFMHFDRRWCEEQGSEDSNGRTLWALGCAAARGRSRGLRDWAADLFERAAPMVADLQAIRALAFAALGAAELHSAGIARADSAALLERVGDRLAAELARHRRADWLWFEPVLAYDNARLPEALIRAGTALGRQDYLDDGLATLDWLSAVQTSAKGGFRPVGNDSFGRAYAPPLPFDQQPLEAHATVDACAAALAATGDQRWLEAALSAYGWFFGDNDCGVPLVSRDDGGCFDGLEPQGVNRNQGAESILALHLACVTMSELPSRQKTAKQALDAA